MYSVAQQAEEDNEQKKRQEQMLMEKLLEQEAMMEEDQKVIPFSFRFLSRATPTIDSVNSHINQTERTSRTQAII